MTRSEAIRACDENLAVFFNPFHLPPEAKPFALAKREIGRIILVEPTFVRVKVTGIPGQEITLSLLPEEIE